MEVHRKDGDIENRPVSKGGKLFDLITYAGFAGVGTFFATIPTANLFYKGGRFHHVDQSIRSGLQRLHLSERITSHVANTLNTVWGGNLMLIPVAIMEHFRTPIVTAFNRMLNDPTPPESVKDAAPQTFGSIVKGRLISAATVFTGFVGVETVMGEARFKGMLEKAGQKLCEITKQPLYRPGTTTPSRMYHFGKIGALDVLATISSATMLYVSSHFFAKRAYERKVTREYLEQKRTGTVEAPVAAQPVAPASTTENDTPTLQVNPAQHERSMLAAAPATQLHA